MTERTVLSAVEEVSVALDGRRRHVRYPCSLKGQCRPSGLAHSTGVWPVDIRNMSAGGLAMVLSRRFEPGTLLVVEIFDEFAQIMEIFLVRVARVEKLAERAWLLGCSLARHIEECELFALIRFAVAA